MIFTQCSRASRERLHALPRTACAPIPRYKPRDRERVQNARAIQLARPVPLGADGHGGANLERSALTASTR
jgi:hypothetical protein